MKKRKDLGLFLMLSFLSLLALACDPPVGGGAVGPGTDTDGGADIGGETGDETGDGGTTGFAITYHGNGHNVGSVPVDSTTYAAGDSALVLSRGDLGLDYDDGASTRTFVGWNTQADGLGTTYHPYRSVTVDGDINLYARWAEPDQAAYPLSFNINNDSLVTVNDGNFYLVDDQVSLPTEDYTGWSSPIAWKEGRDLSLWQSNIFGADYQPGDLLTVSASSNARTFTAQFTNRSYTITFVGVSLAVEGLSEGDTIQVEFDTLMTLSELAPIDGLPGLYLQFSEALPKPTLAGHALIDWERQWEDEGSTYWESAWTNGNNRRMPAQDLVLRPKWDVLP